MFILCAAMMLAACNNTEKQLRERATELCKYIPDHELLEKSKEYMTAHFYAVLDTMFYRLPAHEAMDHEWLYYFVCWTLCSIICPHTKPWTTNGSTIL